MNYIFGSSKHGRVVLATLLYNSGIPVYSDFCFVEVFSQENYIDHVKVIDESALKCMPEDCLFCGMGDNKIREKLFHIYNKQRWPSLISCSSVVHDVNSIALGAQVLSQACVLTGSKVGLGAIINTGAQIDHDCYIGDFCHIAPGSILCGNVTVGDRTLIGAGTIIYPGVTIGKDCIVFGSKPIYRDISDNTHVKIPV